MTNLAFLLQPVPFHQRAWPCHPDEEGVFTFDAGGGMLLCATRAGGWQPGVLRQPRIPARAGDESVARSLDRPGRQLQGRDVLERWEASGAAWSIELDRASGLVTLAGITLEAPWDLAGFGAAVELPRDLLDLGSASAAHTQPQRDFAQPLACLLF
jgi:hypothetical protein